MENAWTELVLQWLKEIGGRLYPYIILTLLSLPLIPLLLKIWKKIKPEFKKFGNLLNVADKLDVVHREVKLFNGKITTILSFLGEALKGIAFFECDEYGECILVTRYWSTITGLTLDESRGFGWVSALADEDRERVLESWLAAVHQKREWRAEFHVVHRESRAKTRLVGISLVIRDNSSGNPIRFMRMLTPA
jgi:PAS domain-containing protein